MDFHDHLITINHLKGANLGLEQLFTQLPRMLSNQFASESLLSWRKSFLLHRKALMMAQVKF